MKIRRETAGHLAAVITIIIWGTTFVSTKVLLEDFAPVDILFYRFLIGLIVLIMVHPHVPTFRSWRQEALFAGAGLCGVTLYFLLENIALTLTYASNAGMIVAVIPMITAVLAHFFLSGEKLEPRFFIGFAAAFTGLALIFFNGQMMLKLNPLGDILAAASAFVWAAYAILMKKISTFGYHTIQCTQRIFLYGLLFMVPALFLFDFRFDASPFASPANWLNILFLGAGASALCFVTWNWSVGVLGAVKTSAYIYMVPVITIAASVVILQEKLTWVAFCGGALTLAGLYISESKTKPQLKEEQI
ncbi:putative inner membrane transporter YhbE [Bacillus paralicheniformis]|uniref:Inner membrane transporter YhbE n=3 Tax=Bacillus paralicheniformis TaxID=1648923 RepID=A0ABY3FP58_9BACI|nr:MULTISPECIES: DMT family transporter [Bacillus]MBC8622780.1 DMT family transporter [Robertmurraya crescens]MBG9883170.1 multidrug transporter [Bacillus paralicheniformis]MBU8700150.1 DMT family transporter [Bacillus paralicheniformis]MDE1361911.1 DMT family transporter [Bacillus paralicheniformis]MDE1392910.1 DMT family transporter [Bacillus paralicheniformis]